ncbi:hypothetical protein [Methanocella sp. MCL-LM]|uniref:hypothetical protein n=1 Tax=Methanocella sp. MCL-LM TaxID=3412035 RepID=UPI003C756857
MVKDWEGKIKEVPADPNLEKDAEKWYLKTTLKLIRQEFHNYSQTIPVSLPIDMLVSFFDTCKYQRKHPNDVIKELVKGWILENGHDVCLSKYDQKIDELIEGRTRLAKHISEHGSIITWAIQDRVNEIFAKRHIELEERRQGRSVNLVERTAPVSYDEVAWVFGELNSWFKKTFTNEDFYPHVLARANQIGNLVVKESFLTELADFKARMDKDPRTLAKRREQEERDRKFNEYMESRAKQVSSEMQQIVDEMERLPGAATPNFGSGVKVEGAKTSDRK